MTVVVAVLAVAVLVLTFLVAGLLRSHAAILQQLASLGAGLGDHADGRERADAEPSRGRTGRSNATTASEALGLPRPQVQPEGREAPDLAGTTPAGDAVAIRVAGRRHDTLLVFLSTGCRTCRPFWDALQDGELATGGARVVVVTKGPDQESPAAVADLAPADHPLVMSDEAWRAYGVPGSPYVVQVDGSSGTVRGEGTAADVDAVLRMQREAAGDVALDGARARKAAADLARERDVDRALLDAGIGPDHPSLYPDRPTA